MIWSFTCCLLLVSNSEIKWNEKQMEAHATLPKPALKKHKKQRPYRKTKVRNYRYAILSSLATLHYMFAIVVPRCARYPLGVFYFFGC
jgi:hypothetical protein